VSDLAWHRLRAWREMTASLFDERAFAECPARIDAIEVEHAGQTADCAEALLLGSWAASRLGWRPSGRAGDARAAGRPSTFGFSRAGGMPAALTLAPRAGESPAGQILSFTMQAGATRFSLSRAGKAECVRILVTLPEACPLPRVARVPARDEATLLSRCLESGGRDEIYDEALHLAARLLGPDGVPAASDESESSDDKERQS
jgi:glucose-6-phosphate dehydrogenase assembly protein OpcA